MKYLFGRIFIAALATLLITANSRAALTDDLVSYWEFEGGLADTALANNQNDGTYVGPSALAYGAGKFGQAIDLDGAGGRNYVEIAADPSLNLETANGGDGNISISAWFTADSFTKSWQALIAKGEQSAWRVARRSGDNNMSYAGGVGDIPGDGTTGPNVNDAGAVYHHMVAISEQGVSTRLWVDGALVATGGSPTIADPNSGNQTIRIGDNPDTGDRAWDGRIDDVAIWNRILTDQDIADIWNNGDGFRIGSAFGVPGDVNGDDVADIDDFTIISGNFSKNPATRDEGNIAGGPDVNLGDFRFWKANRTAAVAANGAIPEPTGIALAVCGMLAGLAASRRRLRVR